MSTANDQALAAAKRALRARMLAVRNALAAEEVARRSEQVAARLLALPEAQQAGTIFCYLSFGAEVDTHSVVRRWLGEGRQVLVPAFDKQQRGYRPCAIRDFDRDVAPGHFGILEPRLPVPVELAADVAVVPGLAFDAHGHRLGFGRGYYDAMLKGFRGAKVALAFDCQMAGAVPAGEADVPMDIVVTERRAYRRRLL
jgi:5-formyltetrahydrofolate cyclo-ligase